MTRACFFCEDIVNLEIGNEQKRKERSMMRKPREEKKTYEKHERPQKQTMENVFLRDKAERSRNYHTYTNRQNKQASQPPRREHNYSK